MKKKPRKLSLVVFDFVGLPEGYDLLYPFVENQVLLFLGEIPNMKGHCVVVDNKTGQLYSGYHTEDFRELTEEEV